MQYNPPDLTFKTRALLTSTIGDRALIMTQNCFFLSQK